MSPVVRTVSCTQRWHAKKFRGHRLSCLQLVFLGSGFLQTWVHCMRDKHIIYIYIIHLKSTCSIIYCREKQVVYIQYHTISYRCIFISDIMWYITYFVSHCILTGLQQSYSLFQPLALGWNMMKCWEHRNHNTTGGAAGVIHGYIKSWQKHHTMGQTHVNYGDISSYRWNWTHLVWEKSIINVMQWDTYSQQYDILGAPPNGVYCLFLVNCDHLLQLGMQQS